jgi:hypothetical protein
MATKGADLEYVPAEKSERRFWLTLRRNALAAYFVVRILGIYLVVITAGFAFFIYELVELLSDIFAPVSRLTWFYLGLLFLYFLKILLQYLFQVEEDEERYFYQEEDYVYPEKYEQDHWCPNVNRIDSIG